MRSGYSGDGASKKRKIATDGNTDKALQSPNSRPDPGRGHNDRLAFVTSHSDSSLPSDAPARLQDAGQFHSWQATGPIQHFQQSQQFQHFQQFQQFQQFQPLTQYQHQPAAVAFDFNLNGGYTSNIVQGIQPTPLNSIPYHDSHLQTPIDLLATAQFTAAFAATPLTTQIIRNVDVQDAMQIDQIQDVNPQPSLDHTTIHPDETVCFGVVRVHKRPPSMGLASKDQETAYEYISYCKRLRYQDKS